MLHTHRKLIAAGLGITFIIGVGAVDGGLEAQTVLEVAAGILALVGVERVANKPKAA